MRDFFSKLIRDYKIKGATCNSSNVKNSYVFFAIKGNNYDGNEFIPNAINLGAKIIISEQKISNIEYSDCKIDEKLTIKLAKKFDIAYINTGFIKDIIPIIAEIIYEDLPNKLYAVTGTNGKTSVVNFIRQLLEFCNIPSVSIGTLGIKSSNLDKEKLDNLKLTNNLTTYDLLDNRMILNFIKKSSVEYCAMEASSIGIVQNRLKTINFDIACFTNFTQDHLDYHKNMDNYLSAKLELFKNNLKTDGVALINSDMDQFSKIKSFLISNNINYKTIGEYGDFKLKLKSWNNNSQSFSLSFNGLEYNFEISMIGRFQIYNVAFAIIALYLTGINLDLLSTKSIKLTQPSGRIEKISNSKIGSRIYIDYAHTPDALKNVLIELKKITTSENSKLILVFGCGGNRDSSKRKIMGQIASNLSDVTIITDDNPRDEDPSKIRSEIISNNINFIEISDRAEAIKYAISLMGNSDLLLIAGKGHEQYQIIKDKKIFFCDKTIAADIIDNLP